MQNCGSCHTCCKLLDVESTCSKRLEWCQHCDHTKDDACKIYSDRPDECRQYLCMWVQMDNVHINIRPDNCKMLFDRVSDDVICATQDTDYPITNEALEQINNFLQQGFSVGILIGDEKQVALHKGHTVSYVGGVIEQYARRLINGDS